MIAGKRKSGKSNLAKWFMHGFQNLNPIIYDSTHEHPEFKGDNRYTPATRSYPDTIEEFDLFMNVEIRNSGHKLLIVEEASRIARNRLKAPDTALELVDLSRKPEFSNMTVIWITRRLSQLSSDIVELSDYLILFKQTGVNDMKRLDAIDQRLRMVMQREVSMDEHNFIFYTGDNYSVEKIERMV